MTVFHREIAIRCILAGLIMTLVAILFFPGPCSAEVPGSKGETLVLPGSGAVWTRDGNPAGKELTWEEAHGFLRDLNMKRFAGCASWRLPERDELTAMAAYLAGGNADYEDVSPEQDFYWSATTGALEKDYADAVHMEDGSVDSCEKSEFNYVWPVCGH